MLNNSVRTNKIIILKLRYRNVTWNIKNYKRAKQPGWFAIYLPLTTELDNYQLIHHVFIIFIKFKQTTAKHSIKMRRKEENKY